MKKSRQTSQVQCLKKRKSLTNGRGVKAKLGFWDSCSLKLGFWDFTLFEIEILEKQL